MANRAAERSFLMASAELRAFQRSSPPSLFAAPGAGGRFLQELDELPPTIDLPTAARYLGVSKTTAYELHAAGEFPVKTLRLGRKIRVVSSDLRQLLGAAP